MHKDKYIKDSIIFLTTYVQFALFVSNFKGPSVSIAVLNIFSFVLQFEAVVGDFSSERSRSLELAEKVFKKDPLDVKKVFTKKL